MNTENQKNFSVLLSALTAALECEPLTPEADGRVLFSIDDNLGAALFPVDADEVGADGVMATLVVGPVPADNAELLYDLLAGNYMGAEAGDGTLAIDRESGSLVVSRFFELPMEGGAFVDAIALLVGAARAWRDRLAVASVDAADDAAAMTGLASDGGFLRI